MLRSMFSAISGLRSHQTMMDVTGNNIANVNTSGYKSTRATFQEALTQVTRGATGGVAGDVGGTNPFQVGLGSNVAGIDQNLGQGSVQTTGRTTDLSINGEGFFTVTTPNGQRFTRSGAFNFDNTGNLVTNNGDLVQGWNADVTDPDAPVMPALPSDPGWPAGDPAPATAGVNLDLTEFSDPQIGSDGTITAVNKAGNRVEVGRIAVARFVNPGALTRVGNGLLEANANAGDLMIGEPSLEGRGALQSGTLEMSNVDLAAEFTNMIIAQRGFQANARTITSSDEVLQELVNLKR